MRRFRYWADPLCLACCAAYVLNRWLLKAHWHSAFLHGYFNDLLLIPCALPPVLWLQRQLGVREHDRAPQFSEIALHLAVWSILFEVVGPHLMAHATGDPLDVVTYVIGGLAALGWWSWRSGNASSLKRPA